MFGQLVNETNLPLRKRRRPALSCIECRRRKIKCDRNHPCNHCKQTKNSTCIYKDLHPVTSTRSASTTSPVVNQVIDRPGQISLDAPYQSENPYQLPSQESSPQSAPLYVNYIETENSNVSNVVTPSEAPRQSAGEELVERVRTVHRLHPDAMKATVEEIRGAPWQKALGINFSTFNDVVVEDGPKNGKLRTKFFNQSCTTPITALRGTMSKTRFFGQSHWMNSFEGFKRPYAFLKQTIMVGDPRIDEANREVRELLEKCKTTARNIKATRDIQWHTNPDFKSYVPPREMADKLVHLYLRTMESIHRILHIPQFLKEYESFWADPTKTNQATAVKIVLVMAIGTCFYQEEGNEALRAEAYQWVYSAQSWVSAPFEKGRLNLNGLQIHCLLLLARQIKAIGGDVIWVAVGSLLRTAIQMGFHLDPKHFPKMSIMHGELRRRLWATVLEMTIQTSLDCGMPPLITPGDYNTAPPANLNDDDFSETTEVLPIPHPPHVFTQSSVQIQLHKSTKTRLEISTLLNNFHSEPTYAIILKYGSDMTEACKECSLLLKGYPTNLPRPTALQRALLDIFIRRFLLAVHRPFAVKSCEEPRYYFSRKVCADNALIILSHSGQESPNSPPPLDSRGNKILDDWTRMRAVGGGLYKEIVLHSGMILVSELVLQLEEEAAAGLSPSASSAAARQPFRDAIKDLENLFTMRVEFGENNVKGLLFVQAALGQIKALDEGTDLQTAIVEHARIGARKCLDLLRTRCKIPPTPEAGTESEITDPGSGEWQTDMLTGDSTYGYDFTMQDGSPESGMSNFNFDIPESWLFSGWGDNGEL